MLNIYSALNNKLSLIIIGLFIASCSSNYSENSITKLNELQISLPGKRQDIWSFSTSITVIGRQEYLTYASKKDKEIGFINIKNNKKEYVIQLSEATNNYDFSFNSLKFYIHNLDSIFILPDEAKSIFLINKKGNLINEWTINKENYDYDFILSGFVLSSFSYFNNNIYVRFVPRINQFKNLELYHTIFPELILNTKTNAIRFGGGWPEKYKTENYYDSYPSAIILKDSIIYSFAASHYVYVFNKDSLIIKSAARSNYINHFEIFPIDSVGNISFTMKYLNITSKYGNIYYDKYRNQYYRIAFHATKYENEDKKTVKGSLDQPWSIICLDANFKKLKEIAFNPIEYAYGPIFITKEGVLIPKRSNKTEKSAQREWFFDVVIL
ncbi:MAG: hypothetical protein CVT95_08115 [Bacteroidetes bacterium HGW-Bacteroidetes-12]|nr:MAG: hypothetical protein CVT95_08115 [Bacteroidetes bacterium HGW-Bacteroidetes-12]